MQYKAVAIVQLESMSNVYTYLEAQLAHLKRIYEQRPYFYIKNGYVNGRKCRIIVAGFGTRGFNDVFLGISIVSATYAYICGTTIYYRFRENAIKLHIFKYDEFDYFTNDGFPINYAIYEGKQ